MARERPQRQEEETGSGLSSGFVGRQQEMGQLRAALEDAMSGRGRLVMLVGEPGIGKTRTSLEIGAYAESRGALVFWGRSYEDEGVPPYWPWVQILLPYIRAQEAGSLRTELGAGAAYISELVPEVREALTQLEPPPPLEPEQARFRLFTSITTFLRNASQSHPLVLVLDDLHWSDQPSLSLLQFLTMELPRSHILVIGCFRDTDLSRQHPLSAILAQLTREPAFQRLPLRRLSQEDTAHMIQVTAGTEATERWVETIYSHTEGNPFFMTEVIRLLGERGQLERQVVSQDPEFRIPEGIRDVIGQRLNRLSEPCNQMLTTASLIGREFDFQLLAHLPREMSEDQLLDVMDEAVAAHLIEDSAAGGERYQFCHALVQETLSSEITGARRVRLHARIAEAMEETLGSAAADRAAELLYHFAEAESVLGVEKLVRYSLLAGERALSAYAWEQALGYFQLGLTAKEDKGPDAETAALLFGLGRAQAATAGVYQTSEALDNLRRSFEIYLEVGDLDRAVTVAEYPVFRLPGVATDSTELISRALGLVPSDSKEAGELLSTLGFALYQRTGDYVSASETLSRALAIAEREQDPALEMRTLAGAAEAAWWHLRLPEAIEYGRRAVALAGTAAAPSSEVLARQALARALAVTGESSEAQVQESAMLNIADHLGDQRHLDTVLTVSAEFCFFKGEWENARRIILRSTTTPRLLSTQVVLEYVLGNFDQGAEVIGKLRETRQTTASRLAGFT